MTDLTAGSPARPTPAGIDPRGPRFAAALTALVLAVTVLTGSVVLLALQALVFLIGVVAGPSAGPYAVIFRRLVRPRLAPPTELEDPRPPRFAQFVGLAVSLVGLIGFALAGTGWVVGAAAVALAAAFLNAAFGLCLGCELYVRLIRLRPTT